MWRYFVTSTSGGLGKQLIGARLNVKGDVRIKLLYNWDLSSYNSGTVNITAFDGNNERTLKSLTFYGNAAASTELTIDVTGITQNDIVRIYVQHYSGTYADFYISGIFCDYTN